MTRLSDSSHMAQVPSSKSSVLTLGFTILLKVKSWKNLMDSFSRFPSVLNVSNTATLTNSPLQLPLLSFWQTSESATIVSEEDIKPYRKSIISWFDKLFKLTSTCQEASQILINAALSIFLYLYVNHMTKWRF